MAYQQVKVDLWVRHFSLIMKAYKIRRIII